MDKERLIQINYFEKMHKGIILEINTDYLHVFNEQGEHIKLRYKAGHKVGEQIYFLEEDLIRSISNKWPNLRRRIPKITRYLGAVAAIFLIIFLINSTLFNVTYAVISLDINPSLELELNKNGEVIKVLPLNEEAKQLVSPLVIKGKNYEMAVTKILDQAVLSGYTIDQKSVLIAVAPTQNDSDQMIKDIEKNMTIYTENLSAEILIGDHQSYEEIKDEGISLGRHLISEEHPDYDDDDIKNLKIHDLFKRIEQESDEQESDEQESDEQESDEQEMEQNGHETEFKDREDEGEDEDKDEVKNKLDKPKDEYNEENHDEAQDD